MNQPPVTEPWHGDPAVSEPDVPSPVGNERMLDMARRTSERIIHCCLDVRGALKHFSDRELSGMFRNRSTGKSLTADEARDVLYDHLAQGHEVIPMGPPCEGFDYKTGCPGHKVESHD
jgi:hypothetical protein